MRCPECNHENTEGAWLCINCGEKLPRPEDESGSEDATSETTAASSEPEEPSRFAPRISENLRRLRDRTERDRAQGRTRRSPSVPRTAPFGIPLAVWAVLGFVFVLFIMIVSNLQ